MEQTNIRLKQRGSLRRRQLWARSGRMVKRREDSRASKDSGGFRPSGEGECIYSMEDYNMALCNKCGLDIAFKKVKGKWCPTNPDGSEHWDICKRAQRAGKVYTPEPPAITQPHAGITHVWRESAGPPWDETGKTSVLSDFRDFSKEEKAAGIVCEPVPPKADTLDALFQGGAQSMKDRVG
jgi:hypothetical protein